MKWNFDGLNCIVSAPKYLGRPAIVAIMKACPRHDYVQVDGIPSQQADGSPECTVIVEKCGKCGAARTKITGPLKSLRKVYREIQIASCQ